MKKPCAKNLFSSLFSALLVRIMSATAFATTVGHNPIAGEIVNEDGSVNVGIQPTLRLGFAFGKDKKPRSTSLPPKCRANTSLSPTLSFSPPPRMTPPPSPSGFPGSPRGQRKRLNAPIRHLQPKSEIPRDITVAGDFFAKMTIFVVIFVLFCLCSCRLFALSPSFFA